MASKRKDLTDRPRPKLLLVEWIDSCGTTGWRGDAELDDTNCGVSRCESIGYVVRETDDHITLALNRAVDPYSKEWGDLISIPVVAITGMYEIRV